MQKKFQAGNLDRKIKILHKVKTKARSGQDVATWETFHECSAHIAPLTESSGTEKNEDIGIHSLNMKTFLIRHKSGIIPEMAVEYEAQHYNIKSVNEPQGTRRQWLLIETVLKI